MLSHACSLGARSVAESLVCIPCRSLHWRHVFDHAPAPCLQSGPYSFLWNPPHLYSVLTLNLACMYQ